MPKSSKRRKKTQESAFGRAVLFLATVFGVLLLLAGGAALYIFVINPIDSAQAPASSEESPDPILFSEEDCANFLLIVTDDEGTADAILLLRCDPVRGRIPVCALPTALVSTLGTRTETLAGFYSYGGSLLVKQAVEEITGIQFPFFAQFDYSAAVGIIDSLGGVKADLPESVSATLADGSSISLNKGVQQLDGRQMTRLNQYDGWQAFSDRSECAAWLLSTLINQSMTPAYFERSEALYTAASNQIRTNFSIADLHILSPVLEHLSALNEGMVATIVPVSLGTSGRPLSQQTAAELRAAFAPDNSN